MELKRVKYNRIGDETNPYESEFADTMASEHFLVSQKKKNQK